MKTALVFSSALFLACATLQGAALQTQQPSRSGDAKDIIGVWRGTMPGDPPGSIELTITPTTISGKNPRTNESLGEGSYQLDPAKQTIDVRKHARFGRDKIYVGLYSIDGNTLRWVSNSRTKNRPKDLVHRPDRDQFLMILERQK